MTALHPHLRATVLAEADATYSTLRESGLWIVRRDEVEVGVVAIGTAAPTTIAHRALLDATRSDEIARQLAPDLADEIRADVRAWSRSRTSLRQWADERLKTLGT